MSEFWKALCCHTKIRPQYSTAYHPQTDGQTERQNSTLEQYLQIYTNYKQDDWVKWLHLAEFAYNNLVHASPNITLFKVLHKYEALLVFDPKLANGLKENPDARSWIKAMTKMRQNLTKSLEQAGKAQEKYYNAKRKLKPYRVRDKVFLIIQNLDVLRWGRSQKLDFKKARPFKVTEAINLQAY